MATWRGRTFARIRPHLPGILRDPLELFLAKNSVIQTTGWLRSRHEGASVDSKGEPIPWITYPAIRFLETRIDKNFKVFEFGSGLSTLWWAKKVAEIVSVEHDRRWHERVSKMAPLNVSLLFAEGDEYVQSAKGSYDIIVIDGIRRAECAEASIASLSSGGVFLWDNTNEQDDHDGHRLLEALGFKRLDFWGFGPLMVVEWCTSLFYRPKNCLGI